jgi:hypothetical protein
MIINVIFNHFKKYNKMVWITFNMGTIYLVNVLHKILIYSKYTLINVTITSRPIMLIIILEYTCNMVVHIHSKYTFINPNTHNYIF